MILNKPSSLSRSLSALCLSFSRARSLSPSPSLKYFFLIILPMSRMRKQNRRDFWSSSSRLRSRSTYSRRYCRTVSRLCGHFHAILLTAFPPPPSFPVHSLGTLLFFLGGCIACFGHWTSFHGLLLSLPSKPPCLCLVSIFLSFSSFLVLSQS